MHVRQANNPSPFPPRRVRPAAPAALALLAILWFGSAGWVGAEPLSVDTPVRGWTILSNSEPDALATIAAAPRHGINHLQLSHHVVHHLREIKAEDRRAQVLRLVEAAHAAGITEVVLWDHALYRLDHYPVEFRTGPGGTLDLDDPAFWSWLKTDYREMLDRVPGVDGLVLTFIETGARAERQFSQKLKTPAEKLAAVVNAVADVVIGERGLNLYARTFAYTHDEYANIIGAIARFDRPEVRLMMKETPHDFFLTHPDDPYAGTIARATLMEFDAAGEFHGQGIVANTWPEYLLRRWRSFARRPHIVGYTARTDRYGNTRLVGGAGEINLLALARGAEDPHVTAEEIYDEFIATRYGAAALSDVKAAFRRAFEIATCTFYTLGTNTADHSALNFDPYASSYVLHVSGKWADPPIAYVRHGLEREYHYWRDVVDRLAPPFVKTPGNPQWNEVPWVLERGWIRPGEAMNEATLRDIATEKSHGVTLAGEAMRHIENACAVLDPDAAGELHGLFHRTLLTARLHRAVASAYFGFRVWCRGPEHQTDIVYEIVRNGLAEIEEVSSLIRAATDDAPVGQWNWKRDADAAERYVRWITLDGWPLETRGVRNPHGGMTFPAGGRAGPRPSPRKRTRSGPATNSLAPHVSIASSMKLLMIMPRLPIILVFIAFVALTGRAAVPAGSPYNVRGYGAIGDGRTLDSPAINAAIEAAAAAGGGTVFFPAGRYLSVTLRLKSNISLYLDQGAVLLAADPRDGHLYDPPEPNDSDQYQDFGHTHWRNSLIWGENLHDVSILGPGLIDGAGLVRSGGQSRSRDAHEALRGQAPAGRMRGPFGYPDARDAVEPGWGNKTIALKLCRNVLIRDITIKKGGHFGILATGVDNLTIDNVTMDVHRDGMDIDACRNVRISNCTINSPWDDGICLKSSYALGFARATENVTITNCQVSGYDEGSLLDGTFRREKDPRGYAHDTTTGRIKFGTESNGGFKNITISNCVFDYSRGLALETVDGGFLEDVTITNITMRDIVNAPIFLRLGSRLRGPEGATIGALRRVLISNVVVHNAAWEHCVMIVGDPTRPIEDVTLSNIDLHFQGGGNEAHAAVIVPEHENNRYPEPAGLGRHMPAFGFFIRHVKGVRLVDINVHTAASDARPAAVLDGVRDAHIVRFRPEAGVKGRPVVVLRNVTGFHVQDSSPLGDMKRADRITEERW